VTKAAFPEGVVSSTQYGERIKAAAIYLNVQQLIPEDRAAEALSDLFGAPLLCPASLTAWVRQKARGLERVHAGIGARLAQAKVHHLDETGLRVAGKLNWLHTTSSEAFTFYRAEEKRGAIPLDLKGGVIVHDGFVPYGALGQVDHGLCNAHHLRELKALIELDGEAWATPMRDMLLAANAAVRKARDNGASALAPDQVNALTERYWEAVREGLAFHRALPSLERSPQSRGRIRRRPGFNLLTRFKTLKDDVLRFLVDFDVPFTNNLAEQDIRMTKVKMKISGAFRTLDGARHFACLRSIVSTARKHGYDVLQTLAASPDTVSQALLE
jgi:transposase